jgi:hypothetical protein
VPLRFGTLTLDTSREPSATFAERAVLSSRNEDERQPFRFEVSCGARCGAGEHYLAKDGV